MSNFQLHPRLAADTVVVGEFPLSVLLMSKDANYPWFILVPRRAGISEIHQLTEPDRELLWRESYQLSCILEELFDADKLNVAALGNMVPQLHLHHVVRYKSDSAWPSPVWGAVDALPYDARQQKQRLELVAAALQEMDFIVAD